MAKLPLTRRAPAGAATPTRTRAAVADRNSVTTAELVRGRVYFFGDIKFEKGVEKIISDFPNSAEIEQALMDDFDAVSDADGDVNEKPRFLIQHNRPRAEVEGGQRQTSAIGMRRGVVDTARPDIERPRIRLPARRAG